MEPPLLPAPKVVQKPTPSALIVDPSPTLHEQAGAMLQGFFDVCYATTAAEALAALERRSPDLLVLEVDLPDVNGLALCERLRANPSTSGLPILLLTARGSIQDKIAGFQAGADDYLVKPPSPRFFSARLRLLLRIKELQKHSSGALEEHASPPSETASPGQ